MTYDSILAKFGPSIANQLRTGVRDYLSEKEDRYLADLTRLVSRSESPIEALFAGAMLLALREGRGIEQVFVLDQLDPLLPALIAQAKIADYRADFLLIYREWRHDSGIMIPIVIECDGHDYHERTKDQARRDRKRDRELQALGYLVVRFTGSEITEDADACADQVIDLLLAKIGPWKEAQ